MASFVERQWEAPFVSLWILDNDQKKKEKKGGRQTGPAAPQPWPPLLVNGELNFLVAEGGLAKFAMRRGKSFLPAASTFLQELKACK